MASLVKAGYSLTDVEDTAKEDKLGATLAALTPSSFRHTQTGGTTGAARRRSWQRTARRTWTA